MTPPEAISEALEPMVTGAAALAEAAPSTPTGRNLERRVIGLAAPVIGENLLQTMLGVVDTILVAGLGAVALAGVGTALQVVFVLIAGLSALSVGASVLVAQAVGGGNLPAAGRFARQAVIWSLLVSVPLAVLGLVFTEPIVGLFGLEPAVARISVDYLHVTIGTIAALIVQLIGGGVLRGAGDSRTPMLITLLANLVNVALSYGLIYGHFGLPALGAVGSAWATFTSRLLGAVILVGVLLRGRHGVTIGGAGSWRPHTRTARQVLGIGFPAALEEMLIIAAFVTMTPVVASLGTVSLAAHRVVINALSLSFLPGIGFGLAATALVGQCVGAQRYQDAGAVTRIALRWAIIWMGVLGVVFLLFARPVMQIFTSDPQMVAIGALSLQATALAQPLWAASFVYGGALRGTGNTRTPLIITSTFMWTAVILGFASVQFVWHHLAAIWVMFLVVGPIEVYFYWRAWSAWRKSSGGRNTAIQN